MVRIALIGTLFGPLCNESTQTCITYCPLQQIPTKYKLTPSASFDIGGIKVSEAIDCKTLGVPNRVATQLEMDDKYNADSKSTPRN